ncbi:MAG: hypothetical protein BJ554DRAFT_4826 [Olpidium bornovanus]|uniref:RRM domain-containing protein n=1 Tax=Olpidium bornovanus TaxID=278681 RepID=A0A8H8DEJ9_9FUNG|nr:MAG: hypothetical protein BJ554DRAFT_4826 [Olpidium bornovanus]
MPVSSAMRISAAATARTAAAAAAAAAHAVPTVPPPGAASRASAFRVVRPAPAPAPAAPFSPFSARRAKSTWRPPPRFPEPTPAGGRPDTVCLNNLRPDFGAPEVRAFYSNCGEIKSVFVRTVRADDRWNTLASVRFGTPAAAQRARELTRTNPFLVANGERTDEESATAAAASYDDAALNPDAVVFVNKLPSTATASEVGDYFLRFGRVVGVCFPRAALPHKLGVPAFVTFRTADEARRALGETKGAVFGNQRISTFAYRRPDALGTSKRNAAAPCASAQVL